MTNEHHIVGAAYPMSKGHSPRAKRRYDNARDVVARLKNRKEPT